MSSEPHKLCSSCLTGNILAGEPQGSMHDLEVGPDGKRQAYYLASGAGADKSKAIICATDIFGLGIPNGKLIADALAKQTGFSVYVPDLFDGDWVSAGSLKLIERPTSRMVFLEKVVAYARMISSFIWSGGIGWIKKWNMGVSVPKMERFIAALKKETGATRVGMAGYCYGGTININIAPSHVVDVLVTLHPGSLKAEQFEAVDIPHCLIMADEDMSFDSIRPQVLTILERKKAEGVPVANYVHEGTVHGSYARPFAGDEKIMKGFEAATRETGEWFSEHL